MLFSVSHDNDKLVYYFNLFYIFYVLYLTINDKLLKFFIFSKHIIYFKIKKYFSIYLLSLIIIIIM